MPSSSISCRWSRRPDHAKSRTPYGCPLPQAGRAGCGPSPPKGERVRVRGLGRCCAVARRGAFFQGMTATPNGPTPEEFAGRYVFDEFVVDAIGRTLLKNGTPVPLN